MAVRRKTKSVRTNKKTEIDEKEVISKLEELSKKKDSLTKDISKLEVELENLEDELSEIGASVKKRFKTTDLDKLQSIKEKMLIEADKLLKEVGDDS